MSSGASKHLLASRIAIVDVDGNSNCSCIKRLVFARPSGKFDSVLQPSSSTATNCDPSLKRISLRPSSSLPLLQTRPQLLISQLHTTMDTIIDTFNVPTCPSGAAPDDFSMEISSLDIDDLLVDSEHAWMTTSHGFCIITWPCRVSSGLFHFLILNRTYTFLLVITLAIN